MTRCGAAQADRRITVNTPVIRRTLNESPLLALAPHFDDRHAFTGQGLVHVVGGLWVLAVIEQVAIVSVFIVDRHQRAVIVFLAGKRKQTHAIVVVAELGFLRLGAAFAAGVERGAIGVQWLAPTDQDRSFITGRQADAVLGGGGDTGEAEERARCCADAGGQCAAAQQVAAQKHRRTAQGARTDEATSTQTYQLFKVGGLVVF